MPGVDLHTHSTASDGGLTPTALVQAAKAADLQALALTDHDTLSGLAEAAAAAQEVGLEFIPGCELSVTHGATRFHLLGLWTPTDADAIQTQLDELIAHRHNRNRIIVEKLQALGMDITYEEILAEAGEGAVGRPHFAAVMHRKGCVNSLQQAFDVYLGDGGKAYEPKKVLTAEAALALLGNHGATTILAHPYQLGLGKDELAGLVVGLKDLGLHGLEAYYSEHSPSQTRAYLELAKRLDLVVSGGSDFHGPIKPKLSLGKGKGDLRVPYEVVETMKIRRLAQGLPV